jgi:hypothetical protein
MQTFRLACSNLEIYYSTSLSQLLNPVYL